MKPCCCSGSTAQEIMQKEEITFSNRAPGWVGNEGKILNGLNYKKQGVNHGGNLQKLYFTSHDNKFVGVYHS